MTGLPPGRAVVLVVTVLSLLAGDIRARSALELRAVDLDLPGTPSKVVPADIDQDGTPELAVVVAYSEVGAIGEDRIEDMVQISVVIPALFERRELRIYRRTGAGYELLASPMELPTDVLHLEAGPPGRPLIALRDDGLYEVRRIARPETGAALVLAPLIEAPVAFAGSRTFQAGLELVHDLDGDGTDDVLLPAADGPRVHVWRRDGPGPGRTVPDVRDPSARALPGAALVLLPDVLDVDGDGRPDLLFRDAGKVHVLQGAGDGTFAPFRADRRDCHDRGSELRIAGTEPGIAPWPRGVAAIRDVDGDGRAEVVTTRAVESAGDGLRAGLREAKRPERDYAIHDLDGGLDVAAEPAARFRVVGHDIGDGGGDGFPAAFEAFDDLDGDGRDELVTVTFDFSLFQAVRILATKRISIGMEFHVHRQNDEGVFQKVEGLDLDEKLKLDLNDLSFGRFAQFAGDFDGDGRKDFVHLGRGRKVTIHRGAEGATYPSDPDLEIELREEPPGLELVRIEDLDGDGRADIRITRPLPPTDPDESPPTRLELYLSGETP